ncbi:unnamed protein product [Agarophyton chilense]|eukprot:gb/GEZJ01001092.1/.p2 GENE.gb/GEZJ01001092.1/~~gb/GEZJ01001092.1/.p2  ORF type:complete len:491 (-),score=89.75 gb/GEZJ01001092.1/:5870-7342(-)
MFSRNDLVAWMKQELPHVKVPNEETLDALTKGEHEKALWEQVTRRVRTKEHAKEIRALLSFLAENERFEPSTKDQEELQRVMEDTKQIEKEILLLREQLEEVDDTEEGDITAAEVNDAVLDGVLHVVTGQEEELAQLLGLLKRSPWGDGGDSSGSESEEETEAVQNPTERAIRKWCEKGETEWNIAESELQMALSESWGARVGAALLTLLHESEASLAGIAGIQGDSIRSGTEELVRDAQLRAFSRLRTLEREHRAAEARAKDMKEGKETTRVLWAQIEAERAALAFASQPRQMSSGAAAERRAKRAVRRGKDVVKDLEDCAKELCMGSLAVLKTASKEISDVTSSSKQLESDLPRAADAAEKMLSHVEQELNRGDLENDPRKTLSTNVLLKRECVESSHTEEARRMEIQRWRDESARVVTGLSTRSEVLCEQRARVVEEVVRKWLPQLRKAVEEARSWGEDEVEKVSGSLREWSSQPARNATPWRLGTL